MDKDKIFTIKSDVTHGRGYVYCLQYHIVWCTKYRKKVIVGNIESDVKEHLYRTAEDLDIKILAMETMPDHIHMLIECKPQCRIS
ncbi:IS200/IS605 family transposase, partial [Butyrivibrio sp. NC3005]|uniref:IS200/IS605 family transposase n=1 Tax=Butyrivibrio sp. NC3005 TaxID=1280685 RepID=UPI0012DDF56B